MKADGRDRFERPSPRRLPALAVALAVVAGVAAASAATGAATTSSRPGSETAVTVCDSDGIALSFTTAPSPTTAKAEVVAVSLKGIDALCVDGVAAVTLTDQTGTALASGRGIVTGRTVTIAVSPPAAAEAVTGTAVVVSGR